MTRDFESSAYGLNLQSDIRLPELYPGTSCTVPDIVITEGPVPPPATDDPTQLAHYVTGEPGRLWLNVPGTLRLCAEGGRQLTYQPAPGTDEALLRLFLLGSGLGALLMQRGFVVLHANAVLRETGHGAILCVGTTGAGKSTTAAAMMQRGLRVLADDVCPLGPDGRIRPGLARVKLWQDAAIGLGIDPASLSRIHDGLAKFNLPLEPFHSGTPQPIAAVFCLSAAPVQRVAIRELQGPERFVTLRNNAYRPEFLRPLGLEAAYLRRLADIGAVTPVYRVSRPSEGFGIDRLVDAILATTKSLHPTPVVPCD